MKTIQFDLPSEIFLCLKETPHELTQEIRMAAAAKLYELGKLSSGRAAELAGIPRGSFLQSLARYGVPVFEMMEDELRQDSSMPDVAAPSPAAARRRSASRGI